MRKPASPRPRSPQATPQGGSTASTLRAPPDECRSRGAAASPTRCSPDGRSTTTWPAGGSGPSCQAAGWALTPNTSPGSGFTTTAFDVSPTAIRLARQRHPGTSVEYVSADLLHLPRSWLRAFDLVAEIITVQALPRAVRRQATTSVARLTAPGGALLVIAAAHDGTGEPQTGPPWPLTRAEVDEFAADGLAAAVIEITVMPGEPAERRWRAEFHRRP